MSLRAWLAAALALLAGPLMAAAQQSERVSLRVTSSDPALIVIDRGESDGLALGDRVQLFPRSGGAREALVVRLESRSAVIEMQDGGAPPEAGTRGEVELPPERFEPPERFDKDERAGSEGRGDPAADTPPDAATPESPVTPQDPDGAPAQDAWKPGMPLLAQVGVVRPEQRRPFLTGRLYTSADFLRSGQDGRTDFWGRSGLGLEYENPFGRGGRLAFDAELDHRSLVVPDEDEVDDHSGLRVDRLSYAFGGTRFQRDRFEAGRFLQRGMSEFGVLDGIEWERRRDGGDRFGASLGFLPEPDGDQQSGHDLQLAAWYRWVADDSERLTFTGGFQKTFHDGTSDRDLFVFKLQAVPIDGWALRGSAWVDLYDSRDEERGSGLDLTRTLLSLSRRFEDRRGVDLTFSHQRFPETLRELGNGPILDELRDDRAERIALRAWRPASRATLAHVEVGAWSDEHDEGGDLELGLDVDELLLAESRTTLALFGARGRFSTVGGLRLVLARELARGRWDLLYEIAHHHQDGFSDDRDDLLQNRLRGSRIFHLWSGWTLSPYAEADYWDAELGWALGFWLQRTF